MRIGFGYDVHKLVLNRDLILGGVKIENDKGLLGHSDADVLIHSIIDSLLGAAALGDIGMLFPDNDPLYKDANSLKLLTKTYGIIKDNGYEIQNIDSTIVTQLPKLKPYIEDMKNNIAKACNIKINKINIKATTEENLGFTGENKGIKSYAVCILI